MSSGGGGLVVGPGDRLVVGGVVPEAAVEDADESVGQGTEGLVVGGAAGSVVVIERSGAG